MSTFSTLFTRGLDALTGFSGEAAFYAPLAGERVSCTVVAGRETIAKRIENGKTVKARRRCFTLRRREVATVLVKDAVIFAGEEWPIVGFEGQTAVYTRVICERDEDRYKGRPELRK